MILSDIDIPPLLSNFLISMVILSPLILILIVGEPVSGQPPSMALEIFEVAFGNFSNKSSGEVNAIIFRPTGFCGFLGPSS